MLQTQVNVEQSAADSGRVPVHLEFCNVSYCVQTDRSLVASNEDDAKAGVQQPAGGLMSILKGISGVCAPGTLTAILG
jgi:hypothetical protein